MVNFLLSFCMNGSFLLNIVTRVLFITTWLYFAGGASSFFTNNFFWFGVHWVFEIDRYILDFDISFGFWCIFGWVRHGFREISSIDGYFGFGDGSVFEEWLVTGILLNWCWRCRVTIFRMAFYKLIKVNLINEKPLLILIRLTTGFRNSVVTLLNLMSSCLYDSSLDWLSLACIDTFLE